MEEIKIVVVLQYNIVGMEVCKLEAASNVTTKVVVTTAFVSGTQVVVLI